MFEGLKKTVYLVVPILGLFGVSFGAKVAPLYFESLGSSATVNADDQQQFWEDLMKYKLWGSEGLTFNKENVHIADKNGYSGTSVGDISFYNGRHHVGGPLLSGKNLNLSSNGTSPQNDTLSGGPMRVLGDLVIANWAANNGPVSGSVYEGPYCVRKAIRTVSSDPNDKTLINWSPTVKGGVYGTSGVAVADAETADSTYIYGVENPETGEIESVTEYYKYVAYPFAVGTYTACPVEVPQVDTHLMVPIWPEPDDWSVYPTVNMSQGYVEKMYIHVPPESVYVNEYGTYDTYLQNIYMSNYPHKYLYVVMPPGGRLTRIFVRDGFNIQPSANSAVVQVVYVDEEAVFDRSTNTWDVSALVDSNFVTNAKYAGNLMFYTKQDVTWNSMIDPSYQGTFMTTGKFTIKDHFTLAGQLVANNLWFESDIVGDFRYVPFDPPILNIDPEVLQNGAFPENNEDVEIPISLDTITNTSVDFNYCFDLNLSTAARVDFQKTTKAPLPICEWSDTTWSYVYENDDASMPIIDSVYVSHVVHHDSGYVVIPARRLTPYDANKAYLNVFIDGLEEGDEFLHMKIFNLAGAVLPGNKREGHFTLKIIDANNPPVAGASSVTSTEDETYTFKTSDFSYSSSKGYAETGVVVATLPNKGTLTYKGGNVTAGQFIPVDSIGDLKYTGKKDDFGTPATTFQFKVKDEMNSTSGAAIMTVNLAAVNDAPTATASEFTVAENSAVGVKATGSLIVKDVDDNAFVYTLVGGATDIFQINSSTGEISVKKAVLDHETKSTYTVTVHVCDMASTATLADTLSYNVSVTIRVTDVNEKPTIVDANLKVPEICDSGTVVGPVVATERDTAAAFTKLTYTIVESGVPFVMDSNIVKVKDPSKLNYETDSVLTFHVVVNDGQYTDTAVVTVKLTDVNEPPHFGDDIPVLTVDENAPANTHVGEVTAIDVDGTENLTYSIIDETGTFKIVPSTGEIKVIADSTIDYETKATYTVKVVVTDKEGLTDTATVTIKVNDVNEAPSIEDAVFAIDENSKKGDSAGAVIASDLDTAAQFRILTYAIVETDVPFELDSNIIRVKESGTLDYETDSVFTFHVVVTDQDGLSDTAVITVNLNDTPEPPKFDDKTPTFAVDENVPAGTHVGDVVATDVDEDDVLTYSIKDPTGTFVIDEATGEITVKADSTIDYETKNEYTVTVVVTDKFGYTDTATVTIKVNDVNETPDVPDQTITVKEDAVVGSDVGKIVASDPDTAKAFSTLIYELVEESEQFDVKEDGTVVLKKELDYETDSVLTIKVRVTDGELSDTALVTVKVTNVVEKSEVQITRAETRDTVVLNPDTLYVNTTDLCIEWKADGKLMGPDCDLDLHEGENIITREFQDPTKDFPGVDTLVVYFSTATPVVTVTKAVDEAAWASIFTVIEEPAANDPTFYVNDPKNDIRVTVTDTVTGSKESFTVKVELDTVKVPEKTFTGTLSGIVDAGLTLNENPASGATYTPVNGDTVVVSYKEVVNGKEVVVSYKTDLKGNVLENEDGTKVLTVTYTAEVGGREVRISYQADAVTGEVFRTAGSFASAAQETSEKGQSGKSGKDGKGAKDEKFEDAAVFTVTYDYVDASGNVVTVSYGVNEKGDIVRNGDGNIGYEVSYTYTNKYGNSATRSLFIVLDEVAPVVEILSPADGDLVYSNFVEVKWTVDMGDGRGAIVQDTLITQGLEKGANAIVRFYRDKAGNEASDTIIVIMKNAKDVDIAVEQPVTVVTREKTDEYYAKNEPEEGETFAISIYNTKADKEVETQVGGSFKTKDGSGDVPYPGLPGHLGPTLGIDAKVPIATATGGLATLDDIISKDGMVPLQGVDSKTSEKITVDEYVEQYCDAEFAENADKDFSKANLFKTKMYVNIWIYTSLGQFVDYYSFTQDLNNPEYVNDAGLLTLYFEMKPDRNGDVRSKSGRLYATGAYVFKTEVELKSTLRCSLPPMVESKKGSGVYSPDKESNVKGSVRSVKEDLLKSFGYKRPKQD